MRADTGQLLLSASDLVNFLGCAHATVLDMRQLGAVAELPREDDEYLELLQQRGHEHERAYLDSLVRQGRDVAAIPSNQSLSERVRLTKEGMARGLEVIYQGALLSPPWHGYSDFLLRVETPSTLGPFSYEVADTKLARSAKPKHIIQLCIYSELIAEIQGVLPKHTHVVLGDNTIATLKLDDFLHYTTIARRRFEDFVNAPDRQTEAEPCGHCQLCRWSDECTEHWESTNHLSLVARINRSQIAKLRDHDINSMPDLASLHGETKIPRMQDATLARIREQARLQMSKRATGENKLQVLDAEESKGFARLPKPDVGDLFFDMEGDPLFEGGTLEYLFGFDYPDADGKQQFMPFWAHDRAGEKKAFQDAIDFIVAQLAAHPDAHVYHYAAYEETALKRLAMFYGTRETEVDDLLRGRKLVDLYKVVREGVRVSEPRYSIKNLEVFYAPKREGEVKSGGDSVVVYENWRTLQKPELLQQIADYNKVDCESTRGCRDWLLTLRPDGVEWFVGAVAAAKDAAKEEERRAAEEATNTLQSALLDSAAPVDREWHELLGNLLAFHKREAKHEWWEMFKRMDMTLDQLLEDRACLADLTPDPDVPPEKVKKSFVHTFRFPEQEYRIRGGEKVLRAGVLEGPIEVVSIDEDARRIALKIGPSRSAFAYPLSLIPDGPMNDQVLRDAIGRYAQAVLDGRESDFPAVTSLLRRVPGNYTLIQGPPGAGKTYTSSHRIVDLLAQGKRVGVSSNTHKAINNLLTAVEKHATERGVSFRGVKKGSGNEQHLNGNGCIEDTTDNAVAASGDYQLVAGTCYMFARADFDASLDYLFVDEAGQVSLANIVAMGMCARNLVLVGDQMQLSQPTQGIHPGGSGVSVLEHLLGDLAIVPESQGEFLPVTRRLHPEICAFISQAVYDGKLTAAEGNDRQRLVLSSPSSELAPSGIRFVEVPHVGCAQESEEESERILATFSSLLGERWYDRDGNEHPIGLDDILVVTPYNAQVSLLRQTLPNGARVGTVDKFQGQEAAVVLISMATSSGEDLPKDISFTFSKNRLNVAISRARCLAVIFASPRLLEVSCNTLDQMRLVNMLCWAKTYSESLQHRATLGVTATDSLLQNLRPHHK